MGEVREPFFERFVRKRVGQLQLVAAEDPVLRCVGLVRDPLVEVVEVARGHLRTLVCVRMFVLWGGG